MVSELTFQPELARARRAGVCGGCIAIATREQQIMPKTMRLVMVAVALTLGLLDVPHPAFAVSSTRGGTDKTKWSVLVGCRSATQDPGDKAIVYAAPPANTPDGVLWL